jgi:hypothetical protein
MFFWPCLLILFLMKTNYMHCFFQCISYMNFYMFRACLLPIIRRYSLYIYICIYILHVPISVQKQWITPDNGQLTCPKYVEVCWRNKLKINIVSSWFPLQRFQDWVFREINLTKRNTCNFHWHEMIFPNITKPRTQLSGKSSGLRSWNWP